MCGPSPKHKFRLNVPFSKKESTWIIFKFGEVKSVILVRRAFRQHFFPQNPRKVPKHQAFLNLINRFSESSSLRPVSPPGKVEVSVDDITRVKEFFNRRPKAHIRLASDQLGMSIGKVWNILRKSLKWKP